MDYTKLHWYSDNEDTSVYSIIDFPYVLLHVKDDEVIDIELLIVNSLKLDLN